MRADIDAGPTAMLQWVHVKAPKLEPMYVLDGGNFGGLVSRTSERGSAKRFAIADTYMCAALLNGRSLARVPAFVRAELSVKTQTKCVHEYRVRGVIHPVAKLFEHILNDRSNFPGFRF